MLGCEIADPDSVEEGGQIRGMELLPVRTVLQKEKHRCQTTGRLETVEGIFSGLTGCEFTGYEIHMGQTVYCNGDGSSAKGTVDEVAGPANGAENVVSDSTGRIYGSYIHGLFDKGEIAGRMIQTLAREKGISLEDGVWEDYRTIKERQYDKLADTLRAGLRAYERKIAGYTAPDAILTGLETRTSSPVRLKREEDFVCTQLAGLYPCGEGAGYAGGIMSAAVDGLRVARAIISRYAPAEG